MKKLIVFGLVLLCLVSTLSVKIETNPLFALKNVEKVCFVSNTKMIEDDVETVVCGDKYFNFCSLSVAKENLKKIEKDLDGIQFYLQNTSFEELTKQLKLQIVTSNQIEGLTIICGYTPYFQDCIYLDNKKVNVQIAVKSNEIVAGFPAILTGY